MGGHLSTADRAPKTLAADFLRRHLAGGAALPALSLMAIAVGLVTGVVVLLFRSGIDQAVGFIQGPDGESAGYAALDPTLRLLLPLTAALALGVLLNRLPPDSRCFGVAHVMECLARRRGRLPWSGAATQFAGGVAGLAMGLSGGREGPAIHLGAAVSSLLGDAFRLPDNCVRTLVACGVAAAIGASFNTPMAGVIFAMEVVMMEYAIVSFIPVIIATVTATVLNRFFFGDVIEFAGLETDLRSLLEVPYIMLSGLVVGLLGGIFILLVKRFADLRLGPFWVRATAAGGVTGIIGILAPQALGIGYDTINDALHANFVWTTLLVILAAKTVTAAACVGVGLPVGIIGPTLVIGAVLGGLLGAAGNALAPGYASDPALYVMLGMAGMMAAVLQAPLAALVAVLELTSNPYIILPAMVIIAVATLTVSQLLRQRSALLTTLAAIGVRYPPHPAAQHLMRVGVASLMDSDVAQLPRRPPLADLEAELAARPDWIVVDVPGGRPEVLNGVDLVAYHGQLEPGADIDLMAVPDGSERAAVVDARATLQEALTELNRIGANALCVVRPSRSRAAQDEELAVVGVLTRQDIEQQAWW